MFKNKRIIEGNKSVENISEQKTNLNNQQGKNYILYTENDSIQQSVKETEAESQLHQKMLINVTTLTPKSAKKIVQLNSVRSHYDEEDKKIFLERPQTAKNVSSTNNIKVNQDMAEYEFNEYAFDSLNQNNIKFSTKEYYHFQQSLQKKTFDQKGLMIYKRLNPERRKMLENKKQMQFYQNLSSDIEYKIQRKFENKQKPQKIDRQHHYGLQISPTKQKQQQQQQNSCAEKISKSTQNLKKNIAEIAGQKKINHEDIPKNRKLMLEEIREKTCQSLDNMMSLYSKEKIIEVSKEEVTKAAKQMSNEVNKIVLENEALQDKCKQYERLLSDINLNNTNQQIKNQDLQTFYQEMKTETDDSKKILHEIQPFIPEYKIMINKYPEFDSAKMLDFINKLQDEVIEKQKKIFDLETENQNFKDLKKKYDREFQLKQADIQTLFNQREKQIIDYQDQVRLAERDLQQNRQYKEKYKIIFDKLLNVFVNLHDQFSELYAMGPKKDGGPFIKIDDPVQMLDMIQRYVAISKKENLQTYLRKIIVSSSQLQRQFFPQHVNESFDPDKIYARICNLLNKYRKENKILKHKLGISESSETIQDKSNNNFMELTQNF